MATCCMPLRPYSSNKTRRASIFVGWLDRGLMGLILARGGELSKVGRLHLARPTNPFKFAAATETWSCVAGATCQGTKTLTPPRTVMTGM